MPNSVMARTLVFVGLLCGAGTADALNVNDPARFQCRQGNCINGTGVVWDAALNVQMAGNWSNGNTIPGATYTVTLPIAPKKQFKQIYGQNGLLESGDQPRSISAVNGVVPAFRGNFVTITHSFLRQPVSVIRQGIYDTDTGIEYRGRFEYLPAKSGMNNGWASGFYIFYGDKFDTVENEKESGLYISDEVIGGTLVRFVKADPSYLAVMQKKYQSDMLLANREIEEQESAKKWQSVLAVIGKVAFGLASANANFGGSSGIGSGLFSAGSNGASSLTGDLAMNLVSGMFNASSDSSVKELATKAVGGVAGQNKQLANLLMKAVTDGLAETGATGTSAKSGSSRESTGRTPSAESNAMNALAGAVVNNATNTITSAVTSATGSSALGSLTGQLMNQVIASKSLSTPTASENAIARPQVPVTNNPSGTVQLTYEPGKGFLDPVTRKYIKTMEEMSCDNVTTEGIKIRDLPPAQRICVEYTDAKVLTPVNNAVASPAASSSQVPPATSPASSEPSSHKANDKNHPKPANAVLNKTQASIAQLEKIEPPDGLTFSTNRMTATNDGVYLSATGPDRNTVVLKRTVGRGSPRGWYQKKLPGSGNFAVASLRPENPDAFSFYWNTDNRFGFFSSSFIDDIEIKGSETARPYRFVPNGAKTTWVRYWAVGEKSEIFLKNTGGDGRKEFGANFTNINESDTIPIYLDLATSSEGGTVLYAPGADQSGIYLFEPGKKPNKIDLSAFGSAFVNTLIASHDRLWIGYGNQILTWYKGKLSLFAKVDGILATYRPIFCLAGTTLYSADGQVRYGVDITPSAPRSFLQTSHNVRKEDFTPLMEMKVALNLGLYCADSPGFGPVIYAMGQNTGEIEQKLFIITPK